MKIDVKETGQYKGGNYEMSEINDTNLLLMWREGQITDDTKVSEVLNYIPNDGYDNVWNVLETKNNIIAYVAQVEGTSSDVLLFDRNDINTAHDVFEAVSKLDLSTKYVDMTSENDKDFSEAVANISVAEDELNK